MSCRWAAHHLVAVMVSAHAAFSRLRSLCLQTGTNVHGHVALIEDLLPHLKSQVQCREAQLQLHSAHQHPLHHIPAGLLSECMAP